MKTVYLAMLAMVAFFSLGAQAQSCQTNAQCSSPLICVNNDCIVPASGGPSGWGNCYINDTGCDSWASSYMSSYDQCVNDADSQGDLFSWLDESGQCYGDL
jgi:hypothetical protein